MIIEKTNQLDSFQKEGILITLAHKSIEDFEAYLNKLNDSKHFIVKIDNQILGWFVTFIIDSKRWFVIIIDSKYQRKGIARQLIENALLDSTELYGWVIDTEKYIKQNGDIYKTPIEFYKKLGFVITNERLENEKLSAVKIKWKSRK